MNPNYSNFFVNPGAAYSSSQIVNWSHINEPLNTTDGRPAGNSRVWGDASYETQQAVIDTLILSGKQSGLSNHEIAYVLAMTEVESGFNPDAAAGITSATGIGQFINSTGAAYGLDDSNRWNLNSQADALIQHFMENQKLTIKQGLDESYIYAFHHDGPSAELNGKGVRISETNVLPKIQKFEDFLNTLPNNYLGLAVDKNGIMITKTLQDNFDDLIKKGPLDNLITSLQEKMCKADDIRSPLVLDLNGDGVKTISKSAGIHFDLDGNGFAETTGWVDKNDGLLVLDKNGNGKIDNGTELFGNNTLLANGQKAANGFEALKQYDQNKDDQIDNSDAIFNQLKIWKDTNSDGISQSNELLLMTQAGLISLQDKHE